jgi:hypothetical protein
MCYLYRLKLLLILQLTLCCGSMIHGQSWIEERNYVQAGNVTCRIDGLLNGRIKPPFGWFAWGQSDKNYSESYAGMSYQPNVWLQVAVGGGVEENQHPVRVGSYVWFGRRGFSSIAVFEDGGSGFWYKVEANYNPRKRFGVGALSERFHGTGPRFEVVVRTSHQDKARGTVWIAPLVNGHSLDTVFGLRWIVGRQ